MRTQTIQNLNEYTCTEHYYKHWSGGQYTDGVKAMADCASAYWLLDIVFSHLPSIFRSSKITREEKEFMVARLVVKDNNKAKFTIEDGNGKVIKTQNLEFTDFPAYKQVLYIENGIVLLPSEH